MQDLVVDTSTWKEVADFYDGLLRALDAPEWHGRNLDALDDSIAYGGVNGVEPPYRLHFTGSAVLRPELQHVIRVLVEIVALAGDQDREIEVIVDPGLMTPN